MDELMLRQRGQKEKVLRTDKRGFSLLLRLHFYADRTEPVFVIVYGAQESIPRNRFRQPMQLGGSVRKQGCRTGPPGWESIPGLLKWSTNTGSGCLLARFGLEIWNKGYDMNVLFGASYVFHFKQLNLVHYRKDNKGRPQTYEHWGAVMTTIRWETCICGCNKES